MNKLIVICMLFDNILDILFVVILCGVFIIFSSCYFRTLLDTFLYFDFNAYGYGQLTVCMYVCMYVRVHTHSKGYKYQSGVVKKIALFS